MKRTLIIIAAALSFASCKRCYQCTTTVTFSPSSIKGYPVGGSGTSSMQVCGMSKKDKKNYEQAGTTTTTASSGGVTIMQRTTTTCK